MRRGIAVLLAGAALVASTAVTGSSPVLVGTVIGVIDGDTLDVKLRSGPIRVRLHGVDAPEKNQPAGRDAKQALSGLVFGKQIAVKAYQQDRYERLVGTVFLGEMDINGELVRRGHAWAYRAYLTKSAQGYCTSEAAARAGRRGLWALQRDQIIAPWEWRRRKHVKRFTNYSRETAAACVAAIGKR